MFEFAGDFLRCCGLGPTDRGPLGEKAGWLEKGVETGGVAAACEEDCGCLAALAVGVAILKEGRYRAIA